MSMALDMVIRGNGSIRSPSAHLAAVRPAADRRRLILYGVDADGIADPATTTQDPEALGQALSAAAGDETLVYGDETLLPLAQHLATGTIWIAVGPGVNPVRELWRLRGAHPWLATRQLALLLEDEASRQQMKQSTLATAGRNLQVLTMAPAQPAARDDTEPAPLEPAAAAEPVAMEAPVLVAVGAAAEPAAAPARRAELEPAESAPSEGVTEAMQVQDERRIHGGTAALEGDRNTETALLTRYSLVRERRRLNVAVARVDELIQTLLREVFATRFAVNAETAAAFADVTRKLAEAAAEYSQLTRDHERVEQELAQLAWLKGELDM